MDRAELVSLKGVNIAKAAYEAYCTARGWKSVKGDALPQFEKQQPDIIAAWQLAAAAAVAEDNLELRRALQPAYNALISYANGNTSRDLAAEVVKFISELGLVKSGF